MNETVMIVVAPNENSYWDDGPGRVIGPWIGNGAVEAAEAYADAYSIEYNCSAYARAVELPR